MSAETGTGTARTIRATAANISAAGAAPSSYPSEAATPALGVASAGKPAVGEDTGARGAPWAGEDQRVSGGAAVVQVAEDGDGHRRAPGRGEAEEGRRGVVATLLGPGQCFVSLGA